MGDKYSVHGVCLKCAQVCVVASFFATDPSDQQMADRDAASAAQLRRKRRHSRHEQLSVRTAVTAAVDHSRDCTRTAVDGAVQVGAGAEMDQVVSQKRIKKQIVEQKRRCASLTAFNRLSLIA